MSNYLTGWVFAYLIAGAGIVLLWRWRQRATWQEFVNGEKFCGLTYKGESFRSPLNLSIAIIAILLPAAVGIAAYQIKQDPTVDLDPIAGGFLAFVLALAWGGWQSYSLATQCTDDDTITITKERNWLIPVDFSSHLILVLLGVVYLSIFLLFYFQPSSRPEGANARPIEQSYLHMRPTPVLGMTSAEIRRLWGIPQETRSAEGRVLYEYRSRGSVFILSFGGDKLIKIEEELEED